MAVDLQRRLTSGTEPALLQVYLLGVVDFEAALALQRRLAYEVAGDRDRAALVVCEHPPLITVGRQGSRAHILCDPDELHARRWRVRWVNRGGGCGMLPPGQQKRLTNSGPRACGCPVPCQSHSRC